MPIKGAQEYQIDSYVEKQEKGRSNIAIDMEERPLTGCGKDFKELIKEKCPNAIAYEEEE